MELVKFVFTDQQMRLVAAFVILLMAMGVYLMLPRRHTKKRRHAYR